MLFMVFLSKSRVNRFVKKYPFQPEASEKRSVCIEMSVYVRIRVAFPSSRSQRERTSGDDNHEKDSLCIVRVPIHELWSPV